MSSGRRWFARQLRLGWWLSVGGVALVLAGIGLDRLAAKLSFDPRIVAGLGILLLGLGLSFLLRAWVLRHEEQAARTLLAEERDERSRMLRERAGSRAYGVSALLSWGGLMWASFAHIGYLPALSDDAHWNLLAGLVIVPFLVYLVSFVADQQRY
ncbi:MAG: hypothetical protein GXX94_00155 [Chloroflexi bacterium]|nr:hypothetical protein [Chloroflexota bacterium]